MKACRNLELVHSDLCGPMHVPSANGNRYLMTFVDDYTKMCWVYLLKTKYEAFQTFKYFHAWIENKVQSHNGTLRIDSGKSIDFEH